MKKILYLTVLVGFNQFAIGQEKPVDVKYRRSSLHTMVVETEKFPNKEVVLKTFNEAPFPDKYNDQQIGEKSFNPIDYAITEAEKSDVKKELPSIIKNYLTKEKIGSKLVAKWFNRKADGSFDDKLIAERGVFNASFLESKTAQSSSDGQALLKTAGFELIGNTFVVVNKFNFVSNEIAAAVLRESAKLAATKLPMGQDVAIRAADAAYEKAKEGYSIWATSYLFKLVWSDSVANVFYNTMYMDKENLDSKKKEAFDKTDMFKLEFIGDENAAGLVTFSLKENRTEEKTIQIATIRIIDNVYSKLQKKYDVFKTKTPLYTGNPITAKIGKKEGLEGGEKFEVLEQNIDPKTGVASYKNVGVIKVDKDQIWDNLYSEGEAVASTTETKAPSIDRTTFSGGKKFFSGMLIRQIK